MYNCQASHKQLYTLQIWLNIQERATDREISEIFPLPFMVIYFF